MDEILARLERRFGHLAIGGLSQWLVGLMGLFFILEFMKPGVVERMVLIPHLVLQGELWRLFTWVVIPPSMSLLWVVFALMLYFTITTSLEAQWGSFRFQAFLLIGVVLTATFSMVTGVPATNTYLLLSLFLAFATLWPDYTILLFFIIPIKMKWLALLDGAFLVFAVFTQPGLFKLLPVVAVGNYLLFFAPHLLDLLRGMQRQAGRRSAMRDFQRESAEARPANRTCASCGTTDVKDPRAEFRVCTCAEKCRGEPTMLCTTCLRGHG